MILLVGGEGSIGRRYQTILRNLDIPHRVKEFYDNLNLDGITKAIIATPTKLHYDHCKWFENTGIPLLVEKPVSKNKEEVLDLINRGLEFYVVNNWSFVLPIGMTPGKSEIRYNFYNTGRDGLWWDAIQLVYIAEKLNCPIRVETKSPTWDVFMGNFKIPYSFIEQSYVEMIRAFYDGDYGKLWNKHQALEQTELMDRIDSEMGRIHIESFVRCPGAERFDATTREDLREHWLKAPSEVGL